DKSYSGHHTGRNGSAYGSSPRAGATAGTAGSAAETHAGGVGPPQQEVRAHPGSESFVSLCVALRFGAASQECLGSRTVPELGAFRLGTPAPGTGGKAEDRRAGR